MLETITYWLTARGRVPFANITGSQLVNKLPYFMELERSLLHTQVSVTCPYTEPARFSL